MLKLIYQLSYLNKNSNNYNVKLKIKHVFRILFQNNLKRLGLQNIIFQWIVRFENNNFLELKYVFKSFFTRDQVNKYLFSTYRHSLCFLGFRHNISQPLESLVYQLHAVPLLGVGSLPSVLAHRVTVFTAIFRSIATTEGQKKLF